MDPPAEKSKHLLIHAGDPAVPRSETLEPRKLPTQPRAVATVGAILDATAELLTEVGVERLTTNAIAERAGINVAALYSYFPNKFAVLAALWDRMQKKQRGLLDALDETGDVDAAVDAGVDAVFRFVLREPGFVELADAVRLLPQLRELGHQAHAAAALRLQEILAKRGPARRSRGDVEALASVIVEASSATLAYARRAPARRRRQVVGALKEMLTACLREAFIGGNRDLAPRARDEARRP